MKKLYQQQTNHQINKIIYRLENLYPKKIDLTLERTLNLCKKVGSPHLKLPPTIHISGTNGKGSVSAFLRSIAEEAGLNVHVYTSPHLCKFNERIRICGQLISQKILSKILLEVEEINSNNPITFFEITTVAAFLAFSRYNSDLLILETGLGGVFDSTNIINNHICSIITPISLDHEQFLGKNLQIIAQQKAGIMRKFSPTIWSKQTPIVEKELLLKARELKCPTIRCGKEFKWENYKKNKFMISTKTKTFFAPKPSLNGTHQFENASIAAIALLNSGLIRNIDRALNGISKVAWPGRIQNLSKGIISNLANNNNVWLDGAHNPHGARALCNTLKIINKKKWNVIFGFLNTRKPDSFLNELKDITEKLITIKIPNHKQSFSEIALKNIGLKMGLKSFNAKNFNKAIRMANPDYPIIICGSLYLAGYVLQKNKTTPK